MDIPKKTYKEWTMILDNMLTVSTTLLIDCDHEIMKVLWESTLFRIVLMTNVLLTLGPNHNQPFLNRKLGQHYVKSIYLVIYDDSCMLMDWIKRCAAKSTTKDINNSLVVELIDSIDSMHKENL